ncbi:uncharacterized protein N7484_007751 [Penicillium longicatenatum]|uniref:uncharacterized protein n=1 Tax=Penicillium longicatenatum TaxID=1561947 RepID=UPI002548F0D7|nr:uncharacterized protein N7484_007751 [Penicillium longicatenatum]KAJ5639889.1 hypothetical protein N7484_007751 [Penicillium longicatenatum]
MAPSRSFSYFLSLVLTFNFFSFVFAAPWIITEAYEQVIETPYYYYESSVVTSIVQIVPTVTSLPEAISTITSIDDYSSITVIEKLYPTSVGTPLGYYDYYDYDNTESGYHTTVYVVNITYSAPTGCSTQWTTATPVTVYPPNAVEDYLPTTAMSTSVSVDNSSPFSPTTYTVDYIFVEPTQIPAASMSYLSSAYAPTTLYDDSCYYSSSSSGSGSYYGYYDYDDYEGSWFFDPYWMGISPFALTMILLFGWIGIFLIAGFIEAWVRFRRLMLGWQTRRGLPLCWAFTLMPISFLLIIAFRKGFRARSETEAVALREQWDGLGFWKKLKLFFIWGFRYKYPPILGEAPPRVKPSKQPGAQVSKQPRESLLNPTQPMATGANPGTSRGVAAADAADPEMGEIENHSHRSSGQGEHPVAEASGALDGHRDGEIGRAQ